MKNVVAMYDDYTRAQEAQRSLIADGIPQERISLTNQDEFYGSDVTARPAHDKDKDKKATKKPNFLQRLFGYGIPEDESHIYAEGLRRGHVMVSVQTGEDEVDIVERTLERFDPVDLDVRASAWRAQGWDRFSDDAPRYDQTQIEQERLSYRQGMSGDRDQNEARIPVAEEQLRVGKRAVETGRVRVRSFTQEVPVEENVELREEHVNVDRRAVSRGDVINPNTAFEDKTIEVQTYAEEPVVQKEARVVEEVVVTKDVTSRNQTVRDTVKKQIVDVDDDEKKRPPSGR